jgi:hypothetical protein
MNRLAKASLLPVKRLSYRLRLTRLYYWSENRLYPLRNVAVMPQFYYRWLYRFCIWLVGFRSFRRLADKVMHTIPYRIRFEMAR